MVGKFFQAFGRCALEADIALGAQKVPVKIIRSFGGPFFSFEEVLRSLEEPLGSEEEALHSPDGVKSDLAWPLGKFSPATGAPGGACNMVGGPCQDDWSCIAGISACGPVGWASWVGS